MADLATESVLPDPARNTRELPRLGDKPPAGGISGCDDQPHADYRTRLRYDIGFSYHNVRTLTQSLEIGDGPVRNTSLF